MAIPHITQMQIIKRRLKGKEGKTKLKEIEQIIEELPGYNTGPYGEIKKWLAKQTEQTKARSKIKHQDWLGVKRQGVKQFMLVGCPNIGKSSLLKKLSKIQLKIANYEFTTLKPLPAIVNINSAEFQIVDLPGLVEGATDDVGGGKRLIGLVKNTDGIILMHDLTKPVADLEKIVAELRKANINKPTVIVGNKSDHPRASLELQSAFSDAIIISTLTGDNLDLLKDALWRKSNLIRVYTHKNEPVILNEGATVEDFTKKIHRDLVPKFKTAILNGSSAKFPNQIVGLKHKLSDNDILEIKVRN
jgi:uncharacterized protein